MAAAVNRVTFSKLLPCHRATGLVCSRWFKSVYNENADLKPSQVEKNRLEKIDEVPGMWKNYTDLRFWKGEKYKRNHGDGYNEKHVDVLLAKMDITNRSQDDMPVEMPNPYQKPFKKCLICYHNIDLDYKNVQLLSQFVSPYTGRIYGRHITGLCQYMQSRVSALVSRAQKLHLLPKCRKDPEFLKDPKLFSLNKKTYPYGE